MSWLWYCGAMLSLCGVVVVVVVVVVVCSSPSMFLNTERDEEEEREEEEEEEIYTVYIEKLYWMMIRSGKQWSNHCVCCRENFKFSI